MIRGTSTLTAVRSMEGDRVTTLELFFDLAFVFAFTQLSRLMAQEHDLIGVVQAMTILALLWWSWNSYGWLANLAHADQGWVRAVMLVAMGSMVIVGVTVLEAYHDLRGGLFAPLVFVGAYLLARITHIFAFAVVSARPLRRRAFLTSLLAVVPSGVLLIAGAMIGGGWQLGLWLAAVVIEPVVTHRMSSGVDWRVGSTVHFTERHGLIVILAIGESIIAIGAGVAQEPIDLPILLGIVCALVVAAGFWWAYFSRLAHDAEGALARRDEGDRARTARDAYTYLHLIIVAGIVFAALGIEEALAHVGSAAPLGWFNAAALGGGTAGYLAATVWFRWRTTGETNAVRLTGAVASVLIVPLLGALPALGALAVVSLVVVGALGLESMSRGSRRRCGSGDRSTSA